jgi:hypothetical protein
MSSRTFISAMDLVVGDVTWITKRTITAIAPGKSSNFLRVDFLNIDGSVWKTTFDKAETVAVAR